MESDHTSSLILISRLFPRVFCLSVRAWGGHFLRQSFENAFGMHSDVSVAAAGGTLFICISRPFIYSEHASHFISFKTRGSATSELCLRAYFTHSERGRFPAARCLCRVHDPVTEMKGRLKRGLIKPALLVFHSSLCIREGADVWSARV